MASLKSAIFGFVNIYHLFDARPLTKPLPLIVTFNLEEILNETLIEMHKSPVTQLHVIT